MLERLIGLGGRKKPTKGNKTDWKLQQGGGMEKREKGGAVAALTNAKAANALHVSQQPDPINMHAKCICI